MTDKTKGNMPDIDHELAKLLEAAKKHVITPEEIREQRISFAYGNAAIENPNITREMVEREAKKIYGDRTQFRRALELFAKLVPPSCNENGDVTELRFLLNRLLGDTQ